MIEALSVPNLLRLLFLFSAFSVAITLWQNTASAQTQSCQYSDYKYIPHPDSKIGGQKPRRLELSIIENPDFKGSNGGVKEYYEVSIIDSATQEIASVTRFPLTCNAMGIIRCKLEITSHTEADLSVLENFSSGTMNKSVPYAIIIPGLTAKTKNIKPDEGTAIKKSDDFSFSPHFIPDKWISDMQIRDCESKPE